MPITYPIVLIGFMGSGKTTVARMLARRLQCDCIDLDKAIEHRHGLAIAELFAAQGEAAFRALETAELRDTLRKPGVVATGGGVVTQAANRQLLEAAARAGAMIVYLRTETETLAKRIRRQPGKRPLIDGEAVLDYTATVARVEQLLQQRSGYYEACATSIIDTDGRTTEAVADEITDRVTVFVVKRLNPTGNAP